jgi:tripartite-type tricarboxylate transporter receptor subunit TctC
LVAPAGLPENIQTELNSDLNEILKDPNTIEKLAQQGVTLTLRRRGVGKPIEKDTAKWTEVAKAASSRRLPK